MESVKSQDPDISRIRMQPQSVEAERSVIGGILLAPESWDAIAELVDASDFTGLNTGRFFARLPFWLTATNRLM